MKQAKAKVQEAKTIAKTQRQQRKHIWIQQWCVSSTAQVQRWSALCWDVDQALGSVLWFLWCNGWMLDWLRGNGRCVYLVYFFARWGFQEWEWAGMGSAWWDSCIDRKKGGNSHHQLCFFSGCQLHLLCTAPTIIRPKWYEIGPIYDQKPLYIYIYIYIYLYDYVILL